MHHRHIALFVLIVTYYAVAFYALASLDAGLLVSSIILFGIPAAVLAHFTLAPAAVLASVTLLGVGVATIFESVAHIYGLWYSMGITELRLFGLVPLEAIIASGFQFLFMALLYEVLFDDGAYTSKSAYERSIFFVVFAVSAWGLIVFHQFLRGGVFVDHSYLWLVGSLCGAAVVMLALHRSISLVIIDRIVDFSLIAAVPSAMALWLAAANVHKVFAFDAAYLDTITIFGQTLPIEELVLLFVLPFFVAVTYELYLDDQG